MALPDERINHLSLRFFSEGIYRDQPHLIFQKEHRPLSTYEASLARLRMFLSIDPQQVYSREKLIYLTGTQKIQRAGSEEITKYPCLNEAIKTLLVLQQHIR